MNIKIGICKTNILFSCEILMSRIKKMEKSKKLNLKILYWEDLESFTDD